MKFISIAVSLLLSLSILFISQCSAPKTSVKKQPVGPEKQKKESPDIYPNWFNKENGFERDSLAFSGYATTIAKDSSEAVRQAKRFSLARLEKGFAWFLEQKRRKLREKETDDTYSSASFLIALQNTSEHVEDQSVIKQISITSVENGYRSFVKSEVTTVELQKIMKENLSDYPKFIRFVFN